MRRLRWWAWGAVFLCWQGLLVGCAAWTEPSLPSATATTATTEITEITPAQAQARAMAQVTAPLLNTYWKLVGLGGDAPPATPPSTQPQQPEAHLVLESGTGHFHGAGGCNRLRGAYTVRGASLGFSAISSPGAVCRRGMAGELALIEALGRVARFEVQGQRLALQDARGHVLLQLEAVYLR